MAHSPQFFSDLNVIDPASEDGERSFFSDLPEVDPELNFPEDSEAPLLDSSSWDISTNFYGNLAEGRTDLDGLAATLLDEIAQDRTSRQDWECDANNALKQLGFKVEDMPDILDMASIPATDSTLATALINFFCTTFPELFPSEGPSETKINGEGSPIIEDQAERVKFWMNFYLTVKDKPYYADSARLILYVGLFGSAFRKVYQDSVLKRPLARFVPPQNLIVNQHTTSLDEATRVSELQELTRREILLRQESGDFIKFDIPKVSEPLNKSTNELQNTIAKMEGTDRESTTNKSLFNFYEIHADLAPSEIEGENATDDDRADEEVPRPYIITIFEDSRKIVSIRRNWEPEDTTYSRIEYYVHYYYFPGFGIYGYGLAHLMGSSSMVLTTILRQSLDSALRSSFSGGFVRGLRLDDNDPVLKPGEYRNLDVLSNQPLNDLISHVPYAGPSAALLELRTQLRNETAILGATAEQQVPDVGANASLGRTLAVLEVTNKLQSTVMRGLHNSLGQELGLIFNLFGKYLPDTPYPFAVPGKESAIMRTDFNDKINIVPVSDPNVLTSIHRIFRNETLIKLAQSAPQIHNLRETYARLYKAMNVEDIPQILPPPPPALAVDWTSENMLMLTNKAVKVGINQDHPAHIIGHEAFAQQMLTQNNMVAYSEAMIHTQVHKCIMAYQALERQKMAHFAQQKVMELMEQGFAQQEAEARVHQELQQVPFPELSDEELQQIVLMPEIQNIVSCQDAQKLQAQMEAQQQAQNEQLDPNKIMLAEIEQRREAAHLKADEGKQRAETEAYKASLSHEAEMAKTDSQREIAREKNEVTLAVAESKNLL